jgi:hypothetical protein
MEEIIEEWHSIVSDRVARNCADFFQHHLPIALFHAVDLQLFGQEDTKEGQKDLCRDRGLAPIDYTQEVAVTLKRHLIRIVLIAATIYLFWLLVGYYLTVE